MFGPAGHAYVYLIYGMYEMFNIVAGKEGSGQAVLIRAAEPLSNNWKADLSGPGKLTRALKITRSQNGLNLTGDTLFLLRDPRYRPWIRRTRRVGVDYAKEWKGALLRFFDAKSPAVSQRRFV
jgi:DNA-3-methyladenine glycosylase